MHTYETYQLEDGTFGYRVHEGADLRIDQYFTPSVSGFVPMTEAEATAYAQADVTTADAARIASEAEAAPAVEAPPV